MEEVKRHCIRGSWETMAVTFRLDSNWTSIWIQFDSEDAYDPSVYLKVSDEFVDSFIGFKFFIRFEQATESSRWGTLKESWVNLVY